MEKMKLFKTLKILISLKGLSAIILSLFLCLLLFIQLDPQQNHVYAQKNHILQNAQEQWEQLWRVGSQLTEGSAHITVKWQGAWSSSLSPQEAGTKLAKNLGLSEPTAAFFQGHQQYSSSAQTTNEVKSTFTLTDQQNGEYFVSVRIEAFNKENVDKLEQIQANYGAVLNELGVEIQWNGAIQGKLSTSAKSMNLTQEVTEKKELGVLAQLESFMKMQWKEVAGVDQYQDGSTVSATYHVGELPLAVLSGEQRINIQLALHQGSNTDKQEVSIGSPLLTIEY